MVVIRNIDNPFKLEDAQVKELAFSRGKSLRSFLDESEFDYKDKRVIVSGKRMYGFGD